LEFPEVFNRETSGFDAIVGNPPFLGGQRITGVLGTAYRDWLVEYLATGKRGSADLVAYFFLRVYGLIRAGGVFGLLAVNTIAEGDTRQVGLESMIEAGAIIYAAYPNEPWPGKAAVVTSRIHVYKGKWMGLCNLSGRLVARITSFLSDQNLWQPKKLKANANKSFQGSAPLGQGFMLDTDDAKRMLSADSRNSEVIFPFLNGEDLNSDPYQQASRWTINFFDWPEERARNYELPFNRVEEKVRPERQRLNERGEFVVRQARAEKWWQYGEKSTGLYHAIGWGGSFERHPESWSADIPRLNKVIVYATAASKYAGFSFLPVGIVFSNAVGVIASESPILFAELSSSFHTHWAFTFGSRLETRLRYASTDCFETYPLLHNPPENLASYAERLIELRAKEMSLLNIGLTQLYNKVNDPLNETEGIIKIRDLHKAIDQSIAVSYGWADLDLGHDFYEVSYLPSSDNIRYTISENVRIEVLTRLTELNRMRYINEIEIIAPAKNSKRRKKSTVSINAIEAPNQSSFGFDDLC
jgi:hypothetical protein